MNIHKPTTVSIHKLKSIHIDKFKEDIQNSVLVQKQTAHLVICYNKTLIKILDTHILSKKKTITDRTLVP